MTNEVIWTKLVLERFIQLANLTEEEEIVIRTRAAGTLTLAAYQDGVAIPGMTASQTVKAAGDIVTLGVSEIIRTYCTKPVSTLTIVISGMAATGTNLAVDITKQ